MDSPETCPTCKSKPGYRSGPFCLGSHPDKWHETHRDPTPTGRIYPDCTCAWKVPDVRCPWHATPTPPATAVRHWQHDETGRVCDCVDCPGPRYHEVNEAFAEAHEKAMREKCDKCGGVGRHVEGKRGFTRFPCPNATPTPPAPDDARPMVVGGAFVKFDRPAPAPDAGAAERAVVEAARALLDGTRRDGCLYCVCGRLMTGNVAHQANCAWNRLDAALRGTNQGDQPKAGHEAEGREGA